MRKYLLLLLLFCIPLFFINIHDGHSWGDDFAQYINEARSIAAGHPYYQSSWIFNKYNTVYSPPQYPPGFPLMLAPVVKFWGLSFRAMFLFNSVLTSCLLFALFLYFRKKAIGPTIAVCLSLLITYGSYVLDLKGTVLADVPCLLFVTLFLAYREGATFSLRRILLLVLLAVAAMQVRSQAVFLLAAELVFWLVLVCKTMIRDRHDTLRQAFRTPSLYIIAGAFAVSLFFDKVLFRTPANTTEFYNGFIGAVWHGNLFISGRDNLFYLLRTIASYFYYEGTNGIFNAALFFAECAGLVFGLIGFAMNFSRRLAPENFFFLIMCGVIVYYPVHDQRYFLPALPVLFYYCFLALSAVIPAVSRVQVTRAFIAITVIYLLLGSSYMRRISAKDQPGLVPQKRDLAAFRYITDHVNDSDAIVFSKPRALALFTGKKTMCIAWQVSLRRNREIFDSNHVRYLLMIHGYEDDFFRKYLDSAGHPVDSANIADGYTLYSLH